MNRTILALGALLLGLSVPCSAHAFCGFYVGKAGGELHNKASKVVLVRDGDKTVLTMSADFKGNLEDFALVVPVPTVLHREQIHIGDPKLIDRIDNYSAPRLVKYMDPDPCFHPQYAPPPVAAGLAVGPRRAREPSLARNAALGVKVEAEYTVGEYDIVILSAKQSDGLETWLREAGYQIPGRAEAALRPYIKQGMKFFVARVNLKAQQETGFTYLRPIQIAYESEKFMLPIRLGMANADGPQDLLVFTITRHGRVESANYRTVKMPTNADVPMFVEGQFAKFYKAAFDKAYKQYDRRAVFTEYAWNSSWCDPCADTPLSRDELRGLGVFWLADTTSSNFGAYGRYAPYATTGQPIITRLHVRYDAEHFPEDLVFQETGDQQNYQARYILHVPFTGNLDCPGGEKYRKQLDARHEHELESVAELTGWSRKKIAAEMGPDAPASSAGDEPWYKSLWK